MKLLERFNDILAILLGVIVVPGIWVVNGFGIINLSGEVVGATIAIETLIAQHYFRKLKSENGE